MDTPRASTRLAIAIGCPLLVALIGYGDYREGDENSMLLLYMVPVALATWYGGISTGLVMTALSLAADFVADKMAGIPGAGIWNAATTFLYYVVFVVLLSRWHNLLDHMHRRVEERTVDLQREIIARKKLEREKANVTEHERRRLGRELHDSLCQHLTGTALKAQSVVKQLQSSDPSAIENARNVVGLVDRGIDIARDIARGLVSFELEGEGLISALDGLAETTSQQHQIACSFQHNAEVKMSPDKATQLYWIAREAVTNAVTHAKPRRIEIRLTRANEHVELCVEDDGKGMVHSGGEKNGIGLQVMKQRAELAGGSLTTGPGEDGGAAIRCVIGLSP
jgi:signal transduction histidine kinase